MIVCDKKDIWPEIKHPSDDRTMMEPDTDK